MKAKEYLSDLSTMSELVKSYREENADMKIRELEAEICERKNVIDSVPDAKQRLALRLRYVNGLSTKECAAEMDKSRSGFFKILGDGFAEVEKILQKRY